MESSRSLRDTLDLLLRHRLLVATCSLCAVLLATAMGLFQTRIYESTAVLLIKFGREMISRPEVGDRETLVSRENAIINVEIQILRSESVIEGAIEALTLEHLYPGLVENPPEGTPVERVAAGRFRRNYSVSAVPASDVLRVSFRHTDPELAAETVNVLVEQFKKKHLETFSGREATAFLDEKVASYRASLEKMEEEVREFRAAHAAFSVADPGALLLEQRTGLTNDLEEARQQISVLRRRLSTPSPVDTAQRRSDRAELRSHLDAQARLQGQLEVTEA
ncbi:MAG: Wzz/FepE/Etk N-terminal domain-containing protein, partial [Myxococcota bacterium]